MALHIWLTDDAGGGEGWKHLPGIVSRLLGVPNLEKLLTYVWSGSGERCPMLVNPTLKIAV